MNVLIWIIWPRILISGGGFSLDESERERRTAWNAWWWGGWKMTARFMRSCGASLMRMEGMADDDGYEEEEACEGSRIKENGGDGGFQREISRS
jgi:hypothetical protein